MGNIIASANVNESDQSHQDSQLLEQSNSQVSILSSELSQTTPDDTEVSTDLESLCDIHSIDSGLSTVDTEGICLSLNRLSLENSTPCVSSGNDSEPTPLASSSFVDVVEISLPSTALTKVCSTETIVIPPVAEKRGIEIITSRFLYIDSCFTEDEFNKFARSSIGRFFDTNVMAILKH